MTPLAKYILILLSLVASIFAAAQESENKIPKSGDCVINMKMIEKYRNYTGEIIGWEISSSVNDI